MIHETDNCTECTDLFDCPKHQTPDSFMESDLLEDMEDFHFNPDEIYSDVYDFPELLVPLDELQGEL